MGQKVHPLSLRLNPSSLSLTKLSSGNPYCPEHIYEKKEIDDFLRFLLKSKGILLRSCQLSRSAQKLSIHLDLYFSYIFSKDAKFLWAKAIYQDLKKKYPKIYKIRDLKSISSSLKLFDVASPASERVSMKEKKKLKFFTNKNLQSSKKRVFQLSPAFSGGKLYSTSKLQFFFFLKKLKSETIFNLPTKKAFFVSKKAKKRIKKNSFLCMKSSKFNNLFSPKKLSLSSQNSFLSNYKPFFHSSFLLQSNYQTMLFSLNNFLSESLQKYIGSEELEIKFSSSQLISLSILKEVRLSFLKDKEISFFEKNKDLVKYFHDISECCFFIFTTYGKGNAYLFSSFIKIYLESSRKQLLLLKFLQKILSKLFIFLPSTLRSIDGVKILINGRFNKRRRSKTYLIQEGRILLQTLDSSIDYFQTSATTMYGSFGIKVWISKRQ